MKCATFNLSGKTPVESLIVDSLIRLASDDAILELNIFSKLIGILEGPTDFAL